MDPRMEKAKDMARQCKNCWGNSYEAARKGIRRFKRASNQRARLHGRIQLKAAILPDDLDTLPPPKVHRQKSPDRPLGELLARKVNRRIWKQIPINTDESFLILFEDYSVRHGITSTRAAAWVRYLLGELTLGCFDSPKIYLQDLIELERMLRDFLHEE